MSFVKQILNSLLLRNLEYCYLCFKNTRDTQSYSVRDIMISEYCDLAPFSLIMKTLFGDKYIDYFSSGLFCKNCAQSMIKSYNFLEMCKKNREQIINLVTCLENGILENLEHVDCHSDNKSLFMLVDCKKYSSISTYSKMPASKTISSSLDFLKNISKNITEDHVDETADINLNEELTKETIIKKRKRVKIKITLNDMICDSNNMSLYKCKICFRIYSNLNKLKQHFLRVHAPKVYNCTDCDKSFGSLSLLTQHKNDSHRLFICTKCGKSYKYRSTFIIHMQSHTLKLVCQLCGKIFKNKRYFNNHIKLNICNLSLRKKENEKKYECDYCQKKYSSKSTLRSHISLEHGSGATLACPWCSKKFYAISRLTAHTVTHTQEKKFVCDTCGGRYVTKESLRIHVRIHTGERPYLCEYCDQRFLSTSRRAEHTKRYHKNPNISCELCHRQFHSHASLVKHKNRHFNTNSRLQCSRLATENQEF